MSSSEALFVFRGLERLMIEAGAICCVVLGGLLFRWGIQGASNIGGEGAGFKLRLDSVAPGTVLGLFGMSVMGIALFRPLEIDLRTEARPAADVAAPPSDPGPAALKISFAASSQACQALMLDISALGVDQRALPQPRAALQRFALRAADLRSATSEHLEFLRSLADSRAASDDEALAVLSRHRARAIELIQAR
jgi:hypothetical protein